jgi:hypothetical protein
VQRGDWLEEVKSSAQLVLQANYLEAVQNLANLNAMGSVRYVEKKKAD